MEKAQERISLRWKIAIVCFVVCFIMFIGTCIAEAVFKVPTEGLLGIGRSFRSTMTIVGAIGVAQAEIMFAVLFVDSVKTRFGGNKIRFLGKKVK